MGQRGVCLFSLLCSAAFGCLPTRTGDQPDLAGQDVHLTILHTSDIHSRLLPYDLAPIKTDTDLGLAPEAPPYGGVARLAALIARERAQSDRVIHLDSGDQFEGAPIFNLATGEPEIRWMSLVRPDAVVIGNHEFDRGARNFAEMYQKWGDYPLLAANYDFSNPSDPISNQLGALAKPYVVLNVRGLKVGVVGMGNLSSLNSIVEGGNSMQITPFEQNEAARQWVQLLKPQVDLIVILSHLGLTEDQQLITGYDAYFPARTNIDDYLNRPSDPDAQWTLLEPPYADGTKHVFIPGVEDIDVIMGGHLHIVLNPSQELVNPQQPDRRVVLQHSGAFSKYLGRLDLVVHMPSANDPPDRRALGGEVVAHSYHPFPVDAIWCDDEARSWRKQLSSDDFRKAIQPRIEACRQQEDPLTTWLLEPYILNQSVTLELPRIFAFAPKNIERRNSASGGDSPLGNLTAESMKVRRRVEAEFALTNTLGIRDNLYAGPITLEDMFNVFPFENTINIMYLSGREMQELFDYTASRSADRGCQSQGQIAGARFTMDCAQALDNQAGHPCHTAADCPGANDRGDRAPWQCTFPNGGDTGICWADTSYGITINGKPLDPNAQYKIAVNDYIAHGGSGFKVLQRNTTRIETGISLRDSLIEYLRNQCTCDDVNAGRTVSSTGAPCGTVIDTENDPPRSVDPVVMGYCHTAAQYEDWLTHVFQPSDLDGIDLLRSGTCTCQQALDPHGPAACKDPKLQGYCTDVGPLLDGTCTCASVNQGGSDGCNNDRLKRLCAAPQLNAGKCNCLDVIVGSELACGHITPQLEAFCQQPSRMPIAVGEEDSRIGRRVK